MVRLTIFPVGTGVGAAAAAEEEVAEEPSEPDSLGRRRLEEIMEGGLEASDSDVSSITGKVMARACFEVQG